LFSTDWETKKLYRFRVENEVAVQDGLEISFAPSHPAGVVCAKDALYVLTWTRGLGTRFDILEIARDGGIVRKVAIKDIQEPSQMAWDGKYLWITSWFHQRVYKVDMDRLEIVGSFKSPVKRSTGIAWDGKYMWLTGTSSDLYQLEISHGKDEMEIIVKSPAFKDGEEMAVKYGYRDENVSPPLEWSGLPANTKSLAVICDDPDAVGGDWTHWLIFNIPPSVKSLAEGVRSDKTLSDGSSQGVNDYREIGYGGPCPPSGIHRYVFAVYALDKTLDLSSGGSKKALLEAMKGHILGRGQIIGRFRHR
jgi:Raf kinase inhibitor-like YbhB/YbcL family protein